MRECETSHRHDGYVVRLVGDNFEPRRFRVYTPVALAGIGSLHSTIMDRSIVIELRRRKASETIESLCIGKTQHLDVLARKIVRWTQDNGERIGAIEPAMPAGVINRLADNWRPLLAIATVAGEDWLARGHQAAAASAGVEVEEASRLELLLADTRDVFDGLVSDTDRIPSAHLIEKLCEIIPRPWGEYGKSGKPLTQNKLARLLKPVAIKPELIRTGPGINDVARGYHRHQFEEAWERFLAPKGEFEPLQRNKCDEQGTSNTFQTVTAKSGVTVQKCEKSNNDGLCNAVAVEKRDLGGRAHTGDDDGPAPGLSQRTISALSEEYQNRAYANSQETGGDTRTAECDAWLRQKLADDGVRPEHIETEFERVMVAVFRV
jgi:hypothetical protein